MIFLFEKLKTLFKILIQKKILNRPDFSEKNLFLQGKLMAEINNKKKKLIRLKTLSFQYFLNLVKME